MSAKIKSAFLTKCANLKYMVQDWSTALLVPIFRNGDAADPASYRSLARLSHARRVLKSTTARLINKQYKFDESKSGFKIAVGTKTAIVRHIRNAQKMGSTAVLDHKAAYDSVPCYKLFQTIESALDKDTMDMIAFALQQDGS